MIRIALNKSITEKGQALILVLILLLLVSLVITPLLTLMSTGLKTSQVFEELTYGLYAADAGVEDALWKIKTPEVEIPTDNYSITVNDMPVSILIEEVTTLYGEIDVGGGGHSDWFALENELVSYVGDENGGTYKYRISLTNKTNSLVKVKSIIINYSNELSYWSGLTDEDTEGLKSGSFEVFVQEFIYLDSTTILTWEFTPPRPEIKVAPDPDNGDYTTVTCTFELVGPEDAARVTVLLVAAREDIGTIWEFKPFRITATAQAEDGSTVVVEAVVVVLESNDTVFVASWKIN